MDPFFQLALSVKAVQRELERWTNEAMRPLGVTAAQADALVVIGQAGPVSLKELGELLIAESGHPSRLVDRLVEMGHVERRPAVEDRRAVVLTLTVSGRRLQRRIVRARDDMLRAAGMLLDGMDIEPALRLADALLAGSQAGQLIARRRQLETNATNPTVRRR